MAGKTIVLITITALLCLLRMPVAYPQVGTPGSGAEDSQQSESPQLSLADLDALIEDDGDEDLAEVIRGQIFDLLVLSAFLFLALVSFFKNSSRLKYGTLIVSIVYLGFLKSGLLSVVNIFGLIEWNFPLFRYNLSWYLLMSFTVASTVLWGRLYCGRICSFGALTQLLDRVLPSRLRFELSSRLDRGAIYVKYLLLGAVIVYFLLTRDNLIYRYIEPFWMFTLSGSTVMWIMLGLLLLTTVFIKNFYCRYLCPLGAALGLVSNLTIFRIRRWRECKTCKICEKACEWGAIQGPRILVSECVRCDDCERLYRDERKCPHWLVMKKASARSEGSTLVQVKSQSN